jgi:branched-chain amino acid transport system substrate-binding protein
MKKVFLLALAASLIAGLILAGCAQPGQAPATPAAPATTSAKTLDIGVATPLTGPMAFIGSFLRNAAVLAMDDQNSQGGVTIAGQKYTLNPIIRDTKQDLVLGKTIAEELIFDKGVKAIYGPFISDAIGAQTVIEPNKVIGILSAPITTTMSGPEKPYTFFWNATFEQYYINQAAYVQRFYPQAKTVASFSPDLPSLPFFVDAIKRVFPLYGLESLGVEKYPLSSKDLTPVITRVLEKKPDVVDLCCTGGMAGLGSLALKQLRQQGYTGPIMVPMPPPRQEAEEVVPKEYLTGIIINYNDKDSPIVTDAYRNVYNLAKQKFGEDPETPFFFSYNTIRAFCKFLDGQPSLDNASLMENFSQFHWQGIFGFENYWVGKKVWGIDRRVYIYPWVSEYIDGKLVTQFAAPIPHDMFEGK